eukprot:scaffold9674_cov66-Phaeocystis_antarctica.AAC.6
MSTTLGATRRLAARRRHRLTAAQHSRPASAGYAAVCGVTVHALLNPHTRALALRASSQCRRTSRRWWRCAAPRTPTTCA